MPGVTDARAALVPGAPQVWPEAPGNLAIDWLGFAADPEANAREVAAILEAAKFVDCFLDGRLNVGSFCDVGLDEKTIASGGAEQLDGFVSFGFAASGDDDFGSGFSEEDGGLAADAGSASGD